jgi:hypothetical protein
MVMTQTFEQLTDTFVLAMWPFYALSVAAIYRLRKSHPHFERPYKVMGYPFVPAVFHRGRGVSGRERADHGSEVDVDYVCCRPRRAAGLLRVVRKRANPIREGLKHSLHGRTTGRLFDSLTR